MEAFLANPTLSTINLCRKDELLIVASHLHIPVTKAMLKRDLKSLVIANLVESGVIEIPMEAEIKTLPVAVSAEAEGVGALKPHAVSSMEGEVGGGLKTPVTLPRYDPSPESSARSRDEARVKVRLARLQLEAQERERKQHMQHQLEMRKLEVEADMAVKLRKLELDKTQGTGSLPATAPGMSPTTSSTQNSASAMSTAFDVSKNIALVPLFRESEVDSYFSVFERIAVALQWPTEVWALLLQCKLHGKAQEAMAALSLEESLSYESVKSAILRIYELVPEAYRQKFRSNRKSPNQTSTEFAREKGVLFDKWAAACSADDFHSLRGLLLVEDFKKCLPECIVVYLNEQKVTTLTAAAILADEYVLIHKTTFSLPLTDHVVFLVRHSLSEKHQVQKKRKGNVSTVIWEVM